MGYHCFRECRVFYKIRVPLCENLLSRIILEGLRIINVDKNTVPIETYAKII